MLIIKYTFYVTKIYLGSIVTILIFI